VGCRGRDRRRWRGRSDSATTDLGGALPDASQGFPFDTSVVNVSGCLLIGVLMVSIVEVRRPHRLVRPFLGVGLLGGYTTFST
jgi:fluoride exporter